MPTAARSTCENRFSKIKDGTGLDLALTTSLIEIHNGRLEIDSTEGQGTTVNVILPLRQTGQAANNEDDAAAA